MLATALAQMAVPPKDGKVASIRLYSKDGQGQLGTYQSLTRMFLEHQIGPDNTGKALGTYVSDWRLFDDRPYAFESMRVQMGLSHAGPLANEVANQGNVPVLTLGKKLQVAIEPNEGKTLDPAGPFMLEAPEAHTIMSRGRYDKPDIMEWTDPTTHSTVTLFRGFRLLSDPPNAFSICLFVRGFGASCPTCMLPKFSRTMCSNWLVPENWQAGQPLMPHRFETKVDTEHTRYDDNGEPYDTRISSDDRTTAGVAPFDDSVHTDRLSQQASAALSLRGISGALFATLLDSYTRRTPDAMPREVPTNLFPAALHNGLRLTNAPNPQRVEMRLSSRVSHYADGQSDNAPDYSPAANWLVVSQESQRAWGQEGEGGHFPTTGLKLIEEIRPVDGKDAVVLSLGMEATVPSPSTAKGANPTSSHPLKTPNSKFLAISRDALVRFGTVRTWSSRTWSDEYRLTVRLQVLPVLRRSQVDLCWHFHQTAPTEVDKLSRLSCTRWDVPKNWQYGQGLKAVGAYILDRQPKGSSDHPYRLWRSKASASTTGSTSLDAASLPTSIPAH
ncbi:MAG: hypothetical protein Q4D91_09890 [Lautropia sp.]|nr:hypothetical protein [Lautropia sp.]